MASYIKTEHQSDQTVMAELREAAAYAAKRAARFRRL